MIFHEKKGLDVKVKCLFKCMINSKHEFPFLIKNVFFCAVVNLRLGFSPLLNMQNIL